MHILVDARPLMEASPGGIPRLTANLLPALLQAMPEHRWTLATTGHRQPNHPLLIANRQRHRHLNIPNKLFNLGMTLGLGSFERYWQPKADVLFLFNLGFVGRPRCPYALLAHDLSFLIEPTWFHRQHRYRSRYWHGFVNAQRLIRQASVLFSVSERTKQDLIRLLNIPADRIQVIPLGLASQAPVAPLPDILVGRRFLLALGASDPRKNIGCATVAFEALREHPAHQDVWLVQVGDQQPVSTSYDNSNRRILQLHHPTDAALQSLMQHAAALLYPSWYEGFGLPLHEAARFGAPCIASTAGALPETAPEGSLFAPPSKPHLWTIAMQAILDQPEQHRTNTQLADWTEAARIINLRLETIKKSVSKRP